MKVKDLVKALDAADPEQEVRLLAEETERMVVQGDLLDISKVIVGMNRGSDVWFLIAVRPGV